MKEKTKFKSCSICGENKSPIQQHLRLNWVLVFLSSEMYQLLFANNVVQNGLKMMLLNN